LNWRFEVNGIQNAERSFGATTGRSSMMPPKIRSAGAELGVPVALCYAIFDRMDKP
jgi:hypothetical protein